MSLPAETKFPCLMSERDFLVLDFNSSAEIMFSVETPELEVGVVLDRSQVESLRNQLSEWLEVTK